MSNNLKDDYINKQIGTAIRITDNIYKVLLFITHMRHMSYLS